MKNLNIDLVIYKLNQFTNEIKNLQIKKNHKIYKYILINLTY